MTRTDPLSRKCRADHYDVSGNPVEFAQHVYRAARYSFSTTLAAE